MPSRQIDALRRTFTDAFDSYSNESVRLRDLLIELEGSPSSERLLWTINQQQDKLDRALRDYNEARQAYFYRVLKNVVNSRYQQCQPR
jgi:hypothetical protein